MKKSLLQIFTAVIAGAGIMQASPTPPLPILKHCERNPETTMFTPDNTPVTSVPLNLARPAKNTFKAPANGRTADTPLTVAPEGSSQIFSGSGYTFELMGDGLFLLPSAGALVEFVTCDDGDVYIKNLLYSYATDTYVTGHLDGNTLTIPLPQPLLTIEGNTYYAYSLHNVETAESSWFYPDTENPDIILNYDPETSTWKQEGTNAFGLCDSEGEWMMMGQTDMSLELFDLEPVTMPEGLETEEWAFTYTIDPAQSGHPVNVAVDGDRIYIAGMFPEFPESCLAGEIKDDKIYWESGQYLGCISATAVYLYAGLVKTSIDTDEDGNQTINVSIYQRTDATYNYDAANKTITPTEEGQAVLFLTGENAFMWLALYEDIAFHWQGEVTDYSPQAPYDIDYLDFGNFGGMIIATIPSTNDNGQYLDKNRLSYEVHINGSAMTFDPEEFFYLPEALTRLPYSFSNGYNITMNGSLLQLMISATGIEKIGLRTIYTDDSGVEHLSPLAERELASEILQKAPSEAIATTYYDLSGRKVATPANGLYIRHKLHADGSVEISKTVVK